MKKKKITKRLLIEEFYSTSFGTYTLIVGIDDKGHTIRRKYNGTLNCEELEKIHDFFKSTYLGPTDSEIEKYGARL